MYKRMNRILGMLLALIMVLGMFPFGAMAAEDYFTFADGVLTITGDMPSYEEPTQAPWDSYRDQITKIVIQGEFIWYISDYAFANCTNLQSVVIDCEMINAIGEGTFRGCTSLTDIDFGTELGTIQTYAFADCTALERVDLPANIRYVGYGAFQGCTGLQDVYFYTRKVEFPDLCIDEENYIYSNAETIPETAMIHGYVSFPAQYYCERNNRPFTLINEGVAMGVANNGSTYDMGFDNDYLTNLWAAEIAENGSDGSILFDYDVTIDADQLALIHDGMVDGYNEAISEGSNTSGKAVVEVQIAFINENSGSSDSLHWNAAYRYEQYDLEGNVNEEYKNWTPSGTAPFVTFTSEGKDLTVHIDGTLADIQQYTEETFGQEYNVEEMYIMVHCRGISHYRTSRGYEYENKRTFVEGMSIGLTDVHNRYAECDERQVTTMNMPYTVVDYPPEENAGFLEPVGKQYTWTYQFTRYGEYIPELDRMLGEMPDLDWENLDGTFLEEYDGVTYGTVAGSFDAGSDATITIREILKPDQIAFVESLAELRSYGEPGQQLHVQLNCALTLTYPDGTKTLSLSAANEGTEFADFCVHACSVCGLCTAEILLPCNSDRYGEERLLECTCQEPAPAFRLERVEAEIAQTNIYASEPRIVVEKLDLQSAPNNRYLQRVFRQLKKEKSYAVYDITIFDGERPYTPNQWGGNYEFVKITLPVSRELMDTVLSGDVAMFHIAADGTAEPMALTVDEENLTVSFSGTQFSPYVLADTVSYYGRAALQAMEDGERLVKAYDAIANDWKYVDPYYEDCQTWIDEYGSYTPQEVELIVSVLRQDHPEYFFFTNEYQSMSYDDGETISFVRFYAGIMGDEQKAAIKAVKAAAKEILSHITDDMTDYEKALYIHDALAAHITYEDGDNAHDIYGALVEGKAVCEGYAEAYQYLLREAGIQSYVVTGTANGGAHAWNYVRLDGKYYQVDLTWDDQGEELYHAYFGLTDAMMAEDHAITQVPYALPTCNSTDGFYFNGKAEYLNTYTVDSVAALFQATGMKIHVYIPGDQAAFKTWLSENIVQIAGKVGVTGGFNFGTSQLGREMILKIDDGSVANVVGSEGMVAQFKTLQSAVAACQAGQYVRLLTDVSEDISLTGDLYLDLNGNDLSGTMTTNGYKVYGMDCTTDAYTCAQMGTFLCTDAQGNAIVPQAHVKNADLKRYLTIQTEKGYTFHRFYLGITQVSLAPNVTGFGYKAEFYGDAMVRTQIASVGYNLWLTEDRVISKRADFKNSLTLRLKNFDVENFGEALVNANVFITLNDGTVIESGVSAMSMRQMLETINTDYRVYSQTQLDAVKAMIEKYPIMKTWDTAELY